MLLNRTNQLLTQTLLSSLCALLCAYGIWHTVSKSQKIYATIPVTIAFYNSNGKKVSAPEYIEARVYGKRSSIATMLYTTTLHINVAHYTAGTHQIPSETLLHAFNAVPDDVVVLNLRPSFLITIENKSSNCVVESTPCTHPSLAPMALEAPLEPTSLPQQTFSNLAVPSASGQLPELQSTLNLP